MTNEMRILGASVLAVSLVASAAIACAHGINVKGTAKTQGPTGVSVPQVQVITVKLNVPGQTAGTSGFGQHTKRPSSDSSSGGPGNHSKKPQSSPLTVGVAWGVPQLSNDVRIEFKRSLVNLEVRFSNGSRKVFEQGVTGAQGVVIPIDAPDGMTPQSFIATLNTTFKFRTAVATTRIFALSTGAGSRPGRSESAPVASGSHLSSGLPVATITDAALVSRCQQNQDCLTVKWALQQPSPFPIDIFDVTAAVTYQELTRRGTVDANNVIVSGSPIGVIDGSQTQASMVVSNPPVGFAATQINVTLKTFFIPPEVRQTVQKEGRF